MGLLDLLLGWSPIDPNTALKAGDVIKEVDRGKNTGLLPADDAKIKSAIYGVSDKAIIDEVRNQTGAEIEILSRSVDIVKSGWEWKHTIVYKIKEGSPIAPIIVIGIIWGLFALVGFLVAVKWSIDSTMIKTPAGKISLFGLLFAAVIAVVAIFFLKMMLSKR